MSFPLPDVGLLECDAVRPNCLQEPGCVGTREPVLGGAERQQGGDGCGHVVHVDGLKGAGLLAVQQLAELKGDEAIARRGYRHWAH